jgi:hypothetical protein
VSLPARVNLTAYHGDTWAQTFRLKHDTTPVDLTGASVAAWALPSKGAAVPLAAAVTNPTAGELQIAIGPAGLPSGTFTYDVEVTAGAVVTTWIRGSLTVTADITNVVVTP